MTTVATYRYQIKFQNNYLDSMAIILIREVTKIVMKEKVKERVLKVAGVSRLEETHMTEQKGKWNVVTNKDCKQQVKR